LDFSLSFSTFFSTFGKKYFGWKKVDLLFPGMEAAQKNAFNPVDYFFFSINIPAK
jgi:hypothetical protein